MKIGEFAKAVGTRISVLRHYDREGLLRPVFIDRFTGYRYYDETQIERYNYIVGFKNAGFNLREIREIINGICEPQSLFEHKRAELELTLRNLERIKEKMSEFRLNESGFEPVVENTDLPFVNDEKVIGKWEIVSDETYVGGKRRELYFLPDGEEYWCYSWTKGKLIYSDGVNSFVNEYTTEEHSDGLYMVIRFKSYDYLKSGKVTPIVLRQADNRRYSREEISRKDNIDIPFRNDEQLTGKWKAVDFILAKEEFLPSVHKSGLYFSEVTFLEDGECIAVYGNETIKGKAQISWTRGYMLRKWNRTACAYEIRSIDGRDYLIMEWKSGDYRFGGMDTDYYVFERA